MKKGEFNVGDIVTIKPVWIEWPDLGMRVNRGTEGKIVDVHQRTEVNGGGFDYRIRFPQGTGRVYEDSLVLVKKGNGEGGEKVKESKIEKPKKPSSKEEREKTIKSIVEKVEQLAKESNTITPIGDREIVIKDEEEEKQRKSERNDETETE